jgi:hypothetical protein
MPPALLPAVILWTQRQTFPDVEKEAPNYSHLTSTTMFVKKTGMCLSTLILFSCISEFCMLSEHKGGLCNSGNLSICITMPPPCSGHVLTACLQYCTRIPLHCKEKAHWDALEGGPDPCCQPLKLFQAPAILEPFLEQILRPRTAYMTANV